jgi:hypothetical protein
MKQITLLLTSLCLIGLPYAAQAQSTPAECGGDTGRYCSQASDVKNCLIDHQKDISDACYNGLKTQLGTASAASTPASPPSDNAAAGGGARNAAGAQACKADAENFCKGAQAGGGRIARCLVEHKSELSEPCKTTLTEAIKNRRNK